MRKHAILGLCLMLGSGIGLAQSPPPGPPSSAQRLERLAVLLDLSDAQKQQLQQVLDQQHAKMQALRAQAQASGQKPDFAQFKAQREQLHQELIAQVQSFMSANQVKKFQLLTEHPPGGRWHHGPPHAPPPG